MNRSASVHCRNHVLINNDSGGAFKSISYSDSLRSWLIVKLIIQI